MESEEFEIKSKQASKRDRTLHILSTYSDTPKLLGKEEYACRFLAYLNKLRLKFCMYTHTSKFEA